MLGSMDAHHQLTVVLTAEHPASRPGLAAPAAGEELHLSKARRSFTGNQGKQTFSLAICDLRCCSQACRRNQ